MGPVIIGGTGHSGTRALVNIIEAMGVWFSPESEDGATRDTLTYVPMTRDTNSKHMESLVHQYSREWMVLDRPPTAKDGKLYGHVRTFMEMKTFKYLEKVPEDYAVWGTKLPQFILIMPVLADMFNQMKFVHIVRHCLRFANQIQWARTNTLAADFGEILGPSRYHQLHYEDLCERPHAEIALLKEFLKVDSDVDLSGLVTPSANREWMVFSRASQLRGTGVPEIAVQAMQRFGYLNA